MWVIAAAPGFPREPEGRFLAGYDPDWQPPGGEGSFVSGLASWTDDLNAAMKFDDWDDAYKLWTTQSRVAPLRPDGQPNKPLTAHTIEVLKV